MIPMAEVKFETGAYIFMGGRYWRVLEVDDKAGTALVIADKTVCNRAYHSKSEAVTWEKCALRSWLNGEYYNDTFSDEEKDAITETELDNPDNSEYKTKGGNKTKDKVFLLSIDEAKRLFKDDKDRATGYLWWLRSPGSGPFYAARVYNDGEVYARGYDVYIRNGVRPAFKINLKSEFFKSLIKSESGKSLTVNVPSLIIEDGVVLDILPGIKTVEVPKGVTELGERCFASHKNLEVIRLPESLKKIGNEAFYGCESLQEVECLSGSVSYGKYVFYGCKNLRYTSQMYRNQGKLCDSFANNLNVCTDEDLTWVMMYQKGALWENAISSFVNANNGDKILSSMTDHISQVKSPKKAANSASAFVRANVLILSSSKIEAFCDTLKARKLEAIADELCADPVVAGKIGQNADSDSDERIMSNGAVLYGRVQEYLENGAHIYLGDGYWRVLKVDSNAGTALVVAEKCIAYRAYNTISQEVAWETCDLRSWLNGDYYENTFSDEDRTAISETELDNPDNPEYRTKGGNETKDKVFLLSIEEAKNLFKDDKDRAAGEMWWLRSPGGRCDRAAAVFYSGDIFERGNEVNRYEYVRPALTVNLKSNLFKSLIGIDSEGKEIVNSPAVIIRNGVVVDSHPNVHDVKLPGYVKTIAEGAFKKRVELVSVAWIDKAPKIKTDAFDYCPKLHLPAELYSGAKLPAGLDPYLPDEASVLANVMRLSKRNSDYNFELFNRIIKGYSSELVLAITDELIKQTGDGMIADPEMLLRFAFTYGAVLGKARVEAVSKILKRSKQKFSVDLLMREVENGDPNRIDKFWFYYELSPLVFTSDLEGPYPLSVYLRVVWPIASSYDFGWVDTKNYKKGALDRYEKPSEDDTEFAKSEHENLMQLLSRWKKEIGAEWYAPYAAFANDEELSTLLSELKSWEKDKKRREQIIRVRGAVLLNDTLTAMRYADSLGLLARYAALRGLDADTIRDGIISDFGLDQNGFRSWVLGGRRITAKLEDDLTLSLTDDSGKVLRSVPKKGADPTEYETVNKEYANMKKAIKTTAKARNDKIFADFLSGSERSGSDWKSAYLNNPVLRVLARLIVWDQDGTTFTLDNEGNACDVNGAAYAVTEAPVKVAHPMEMSKEAIEKWQRYYNDRNLRQPFEQVWEPVADASLVKPGRYNDCTVPLYALMNKDKHGIIMEGQSRIKMKDCSAGLKLIAGHKDWINNEFEVTDFTFEKYTRQVNHIVVMLDKATVAGRIRKDDISVAQWLDLFTLAQIMGFIDIASEADAFNVKALLLEYKNTHFADFDPMEQFTLEW